MKKVIREENANLNNNQTKKLVLKGLSVILALTMSLSLAGCKKGETPVQTVVETQVEQKATPNETGENPYMEAERTITRNHSIENPFDNLQINSNIDAISEEELQADRDELANNNAKEGFENFEVMYIADDPDLWPYTPTSRIEVDNMILELVHPEEITTENGKTIYKAPAGYVLRGDICYRILSTTGVAPKGYVLGADNQTLNEVDTEIEYMIPEEANYFLVGSKVVEVIHARRETIGNLNYDMLPMEYERVNDFGYIIRDAEPIVSLSK